MDVEYMSAEEIRREYAEARDQRYQIEVLADMNFCNKSDIKAIINGKCESVEEAIAMRSKSNSSEKKKTVPVSEKEIQKIIKYHRNGMYNSEIAAIVGRSPSKVCVVCKQYDEGLIEYKPELIEGDTEPTMSHKAIEPTSAASIANQMMESLFGNLSDFIVEIKASTKEYVVRVMDERSGEDVIIRRKFLCDS